MRFSARTSAGSKTLAPSAASAFLFALLVLAGLPGFAAETPASAGGLASLVAEFRRTIPGAGSGGFLEPAAAELRRFRECAQALFAGETERAAACFETVGYELRTLEDPSTGKLYDVALEKEPRTKGGGLYILDRASERNVVVGVPHPLYDVGTAEEGCAIFQALGARALFLAGAHRCAAEAASPCRGRTEACGGGEYRISDAAHNASTFFHAAHEAAYSLDPKPIAISLHGQSSSALGAILSDGTSRAAGPEALVNRLRDALRRRGVPSRSCNAREHSGLELCGTTNVQGRLFNGSPDPCSSAAPSASGLFLHIEQSRSLRRDPSALIAALLEVLPVDAVPRAGSGTGGSGSKAAPESATSAGRP